jgi:hypothetical protein
VVSFINLIHFHVAILCNGSWFSRVIFSVASFHQSLKNSWCLNYRILLVTLKGIFFGAVICIWWWFHFAVLFEFFNQLSSNFDSVLQCYWYNILLIPSTKLGRFGLTLLGCDAICWICSKWNCGWDFWWCDSTCFIEHPPLAMFVNGMLLLLYSSNTCG